MNLLLEYHHETAILRENMILFKYSVQGFVL
ncbi:Uncharacterized protein NV38_0002482 [Leptospira kirschneri serovar Mozdok]|nr:Uncharacterized protein NV38_0002482 [Leptospira kirschneri serovar Mozdok]